LFTEIILNDAYIAKILYVFVQSWLQSHVLCPDGKSLSVLGLKKWKVDQVKNKIKNGPSNSKVICS
jgi:hemerythrin